MEIDASVKTIVARNLADLRIKSGLTQLQRAEKLNYSDKAVSKWERAESLPDLEVLIKVAEIYDVDLNYLVSPTHDARYSTSPKERQKRARRNYYFITAMSILLVWLIASLVFVVLVGIFDYKPVFVLSFLYAVPISCIVLLVLNSVWFGGRKNFYIISVLMWSCLGTIVATIHAFTGRFFPLVLILGIPGQIIIALWCLLNNPDHLKPNRDNSKHLQKEQ